MRSSSETSGSNVSLASRAWAIRRYALRMAEVQGQGYVGQALGVADVFATSYFHAMDYRPDDPEWDGRDRFYLSIGHYAIALYAALIEAGILPEDEIETYGMDDSRMPMSCMAAYTPGMEITGGSLGHGLGIAVGAALGLKRKASSSFVYNMLSDGELGEGSTWEAVMSAVQWKLDNLIAIVDFNNQQADGPTLDAQALQGVEAVLCRHQQVNPEERKEETEEADDGKDRCPAATPEEAPKWTAFGWYAQEVDGNDLSALVQAFDNARNHPEPRPRVIICHTKMCKGIPFLEERESTHFIRVEPDEWAKAIAVLDEDKPL